MAFRRVCKDCEKQLLDSFVVSVRPSVHLEQFGSHEADFHKIWHLSSFRKSVEKIQVSLQYEKNNGHFTWISTYIYDSIALLSMRHFLDKGCSENQNTHFIYSNVFQKPCRLWDVEKYGSARQPTHDRHLRTACWITTATDTHWEYEILIRFPWQNKKVF